MTAKTPQTPLCFRATLRKGLVVYAQLRKYDQLQDQRVKFHIFMPGIIRSSASMLSASL